MNKTNYTIKSKYNTYNIPSQNLAVAKIIVMKEAILEAKGPVMGQLK